MAVELTLTWESGPAGVPSESLIVPFSSIGGANEVTVAVTGAAGFDYRIVLTRRPEGDSSAPADEKDPIALGVKSTNASFAHTVAKVGTYTFKVQTSPVGAGAWTDVIEPGTGLSPSNPAVTYERHIFVEDEHGLIKLQDQTRRQQCAYPGDVDGRGMVNLLDRNASKLRAKLSAGGGGGGSGALVNTVDDAVNGGVTSIYTAVHTTSGTPVAGLGAGTLYRAEDSAGQTEDVALFAGVFTTVTSGSEASRAVIYARAGGAALAPVANFWGSGRINLGGASPSTEPPAVVYVQSKTGSVTHLPTVYVAASNQTAVASGQTAPSVVYDLGVGVVNTWAVAVAPAIAYDYGIIGSMAQAFPSATTIPDAATFYVAEPPTAGTNCTITRRWAGLFGGHVGPAATTTHDLGASGRLWRTAYVEKLLINGAADPGGSVRVALVGNQQFYGGALFLTQTSPTDTLTIDNVTSGAARAFANSSAPLFLGGGNNSTTHLVLSGDGASVGIGLAVGSIAARLHVSGGQARFDHDVRLGGSGNQLGCFGNNGAGKQTVTGSRGGNAALASLLTALAAYNLITDSSSA
jgi:hypothetical protein